MPDLANPLRRALCLAALAAPLTGQSPGGSDQGLDIPRTLTRVKILVSAKQAEKASLLLQETMHRVLEQPESASRAELLRQLDDRLFEVDKLQPGVRQGRRAAADQLIALSRSFDGKRWHRAALFFLREAEAIDARAASAPLARLRRVAAKAFKAEAAAKITGDATVEPAADSRWLKFSGRDLFGAGFKITPTEISGPATVANQERPHYMVCDRPTHKDGIVSVEVLRPDPVGSVAFLFGVEDMEDFFYFVVHYYKEHIWVQLSHYADEKWSELGGTDCYLSKQDRLQWQRYGVRIEGKRVTTMIGERELLRAECSRPPHGKIGMALDGKLGAMQPVKFRRPMIEAIVEKPKEDPNKAADRALEQTLQAQMTAATALLRGQKEAALIALLETRRQAVAMRDQRRRAALMRKIDQLIRRSWRQHKQITDLRRAAAAAVLEPAKAYFDARWYTTSKQLIAIAASLDFALAERELAKLEAQLARKAKSAAGVEAEPQGPVDLALLHKWFDAGRRLRGDAWQWTEPALVPPVSKLGATTMISTGRLGKKGKVAVQAKASKRPVHLGMVLGYKSKHSYYVLHLMHGKQNSFLFLTHWNGKSLRYISQTRTLRFATAARQQWMTLDLELTGSALLVKCGKAMKQVFWVAGENLSGQIGLQLQVADNRQGVQFRNLVIDAK